MLQQILTRLTCFLVGHDLMSWGPTFWIEVEGYGSAPGRRALCRRCVWAGYRTTWGSLIGK